LRPVALKQAEAEIERHKQKLEKVLALPVDDPMFERYYDGTRETYIETFRKHVETAIAEAMRVREMFTKGPVMDKPPSPHVEAREVT